MTFCMPVDWGYRAYAANVFAAINGLQTDLKPTLETKTKPLTPIFCGRAPVSEGAKDHFPPEMWDRNRETLKLQKDLRSATRVNPVLERTLIPLRTKEGYVGRAWYRLARKSPRGKSVCRGGFELFSMHDGPHNHLKSLQCAIWLGYR
jgi:hypothetical protein